MKTRFRLMCRGVRGGVFSIDTQTRKRTQVWVAPEAGARQTVAAKDEAPSQPVRNPPVAKASFERRGSGLTTGTDAIRALAETQREVCRPHLLVIVPFSSRFSSFKKFRQMPRVYETEKR